MKEKILKSAQANGIPEGSSGLWYIRKLHLQEPRLTKRKNKYVWVSGVITYLHLITDSTIHKNPPGEIVMDDSIYEMYTHLDFMLKAHGKVLVTGLGLGCVIRGLLVNPRVKFITCIEKSEHVLKLVEPYMPKDRLKIIHADALKWVKSDDRKFDCAWHDLYTNKDNGEPNLAVWHTELIFNCRRKVKFQGAWGYPKNMKKIMSQKKYSII